MKNSKRLEIIRENQSQYGTIQFIGMKQYKRERIAGQVLLTVFAFLLAFPYYYDFVLGLYFTVFLGLAFALLLAIFLALRPFVIYEKGISFSNSRIPFLHFKDIIDARTGKTIRYKTPYIMLNTIDGRSLCISKVTIKHMSNEIQPDIEPIIKLVENGIQKTRFEHRLKWDKLVLNIINKKIFASLRAKVKFKVVNYADKNNITHITLDVLARTIESYPKVFSKKYLYGNFPDYVKKVSSRIQSTSRGYKRIS